MKIWVVEMEFEERPGWFPSVFVGLTREGARAEARGVQPLSFWFESVARSKMLAGLTGKGGIIFRIGVMPTVGVADTSDARGDVVSLRGVLRSTHVIHTSNSMGRNPRYVS